MDAGCHAGQSGHGLALASCGDQHGGLRRIVFQLVNVNERSVGNIDISQLTGNINDRYHAAAFHYYLSAIFISRIYYLLHTVYIGSKGSHDNAVIRMLCENRIKGLSHAALGHGKAGTGGIGTVCHHGKDALLSQLCKALQVNGIAKYRRIINLKVAGVEHNADR